MQEVRLSVRWHADSKGKELKTIENSYDTLIYKNNQQFHTKRKTVTLITIKSQNFFAIKSNTCKYSCLDYTGIGKFMAQAI